MNIEFKDKKLLIVIPYRNREDHLKQIIPFLNQKLREQKINFEIVVVEQKDDNLFNRGLLCNIGFLEYGYKFDYICFHDVDMIGNNIDYSYSNIPTSLIRHRSKLGDKRVFDDYFGGITIFPSEIFKKINGFDNEYWGWGAEDDDLKYRCSLLDIDTSFREGSCEDLEIENEDEKRKNNPYYDNNLKKLKKFKKYYNFGATPIEGLSNCYHYYQILKKVKYKNYKKIIVNTSHNNKNIFVFSSVGSELDSYYSHQVFKSWELNEYDSGCTIYSNNNFIYNSYFKNQLYKKDYKFPNFFYYNNLYHILDKYKYVAIIDDDLIFNQSNTIKKITSYMDLYDLSICGINNIGKFSFDIMNTHMDELWITNFCEMGLMVFKCEHLKKFLKEIVSYNIVDFGYDILICKLFTYNNFNIGIIKNMSFYNPTQKERYVGKDLWTDTGIPHPKFNVSKKIRI